MQALMQNTHDSLRHELLDKIQRSGDYSCPETEGGCVSGVFEAEPNLEVLAEFCQYVIDAGKTVYDGEWNVSTLFSFLENKLQKYHSGDGYSITLSFGSILPVLALLPFLSVYSKISLIDIEFLHDKWESRGDYTSKKHVGIALNNGEFVVGDSKKIKRQATRKPIAKKKNSEGFKSNIVLPSREMRSREYSVEKNSASEYRVTSKNKKHTVIERDGYFWCDCGDFLDEPKNCKHIVAVKRFINDPFVLLENTKR
jgi:hypothetical protein